MKTFLTLVVFIGVSASGLFAQNPAQAYIDSVNQALQNFTAENSREAVVHESIAEYEAYRDRVLEDFENFQQEMIEKWGEFNGRTKTEWVEYIDGGDTRVNVDFEEDEVTIDVLIEDPDNIDDVIEEIVEDLPEKIVETINHQGTEMGFVGEETGDVPAFEEPVLEDQIDKDSGESDEDFAERVVEENEVEVKKVVGEDGEERVYLSINFALAPNSIQTRAEKVQEYVYNYAESYEIEPSLVFAIIHTESYFNPLATSPANAYGLMQLVPTSGGADAYRSIYSGDGIPSSDYLFQPENNVKLGCAYIDILLNRYLVDVENDLSRIYMAISAYNTGSGNVFKAYDDDARKWEAISRIDQMSPQENYDYLIVNLPYEETRDYLRKVVDRSKMYESWQAE